jgi:hypothetical protein
MGALVGAVTGIVSVAFRLAALYGEKIFFPYHGVPGKAEVFTLAALGRLLTEVDGEPTLLSWSGSMFEYLMPQLVMPNYEGTLLDQTAKTSVERQIDYGRQRDVPWGISESG